MPSKQTKTRWMMSTFCKPVISNCAWPWRHPRLHYCTWHENPGGTQVYSTLLYLAWKLLMLCNSASASGLHQSEQFHIQELSVIDKDPKKQQYSSQLPGMPRWKLWGYEYVPLSSNTYDPHRRLLYLFSYFTSALAQAFNLNGITQ